MDRTEEQEEREILRLLESVDRDPPALTADAVAAIALGRRRRSGGLRWAAVILLVGVLGGVAYAMPGSPLRSWIEALVSAQSVPVSEEPIPTRAAPAGIAVDPGEQMSVVFDRPAAGTRARISLTDESQLAIETPAGGARFTAGSDRILVSLIRDSSLVQVRIPRSAREVEIRVGNRQLLRKIGPEIVTSVPADRDSSYSFPLAP